MIPNPAPNPTSNPRTQAHTLNLEPARSTNTSNVVPKRKAQDSGADKVLGQSTTEPQLSDVGAALFMQETTSTITKEPKSKLPKTGVAVTEVMPAWQKFWNSQAYRELESLDLDDLVDDLRKNMRETAKTESEMPISDLVDDSGRLYPYIRPSLDSMNNQIKDPLAKIVIVPDVRLYVSVTSTEYTVNAFCDGSTRECSQKAYASDWNGQGNIQVRAVLRDGYIRQGRGFPQNRSIDITNLPKIEGEIPILTGTWILEVLIQNFFPKMYDFLISERGRERIENSIRDQIEARQLTNQGYANLSHECLVWVIAISGYLAGVIPPVWTAKCQSEICVLWLSKYLFSDITPEGDPVFPEYFENGGIFDIFISAFDPIVLEFSLMTILHPETIPGKEITSKEKLQSAMKVKAFEKLVAMRMPEIRVRRYQTQTQMLERFYTFLTSSGLCDSEKKNVQTDCMERTGQYRGGEMLPFLLAVGDGFFMKELVGAYDSRKVRIESLLKSGVAIAEALPATRRPKKMTDATDLVTFEFRLDQEATPKDLRLDDQEWTWLEGSEEYPKFVTACMRITGIAMKGIPTFAYSNFRPPTCRPLDHMIQLVLDVDGPERLVRLKQIMKGLSSDLQATIAQSLPHLKGGEEPEKRKWLTRLEEKVEQVEGRAPKSEWPEDAPVGELTAAALQEVSRKESIEKSKKYQEKVEQEVQQLRKEQNICLGGVDGDNTLQQNAMLRMFSFIETCDEVSDLTSMTGASTLYDLHSIAEAEIGDITRMESVSNMFGTGKPNKSKPLSADDYGKRLVGTVMNARIWGVKHGDFRERWIKRYNELVAEEKLRTGNILVKELPKEALEHFFREMDQWFLATLHSKIDSLFDEMEKNSRVLLLWTNESIEDCAYEPTERECPEIVKLKPQHRRIAYRREWQLLQNADARFSSLTVECTGRRGYKWEEYESQIYVYLNSTEYGGRVIRWLLLPALDRQDKSEQIMERTGWGGNADQPWCGLFWRWLQVAEVQTFQTFLQWVHKRSAGRELLAKEGLTVDKPPKYWLGTATELKQMFDAQGVAKARRRGGRNGRGARGLQVAHENRPLHMERQRRIPSEIVERVPGLEARRGATRPARCPPRIWSRGEMEVLEEIPENQPMEEPMEPAQTEELPVENEQETPVASTEVVPGAVKEKPVALICPSVMAAIEALGDDPMAKDLQAFISPSFEKLEAIQKCKWLAEIGEKRMNMLRRNDYRLELYARLAVSLQDVIMEVIPMMPNPLFTSWLHPAVARTFRLIGTPLTETCRCSICPTMGPNPSYRPCRAGVNWIFVAMGANHFALCSFCKRAHGSAQQQLSVIQFSDSDEENPKEEVDLTEHILSLDRVLRFEHTSPTVALAEAMPAGGSEYGPLSMDISDTDGAAELPLPDPDSNDIMEDVVADYGGDTDDVVDAIHEVMSRPKEKPQNAKLAWEVFVKHWGAKKSLCVDEQYLLTRTNWIKEIMERVKDCEIGLRMLSLRKRVQEFRQNQTGVALLNHEEMLGNFNEAEIILANAHWAHKMLAKYSIVLMHYTWDGEPTNVEALAELPGFMFEIAFETGVAKYNIRGMLENKKDMYEIMMRCIRDADPSNQRREGWGKITPRTVTNFRGYMSPSRLEWELSLADYEFYVRELRTLKPLAEIWEDDTSEFLNFLTMRKYAEYMGILRVVATLWSAPPAPDEHIRLCGRRWTKYDLWRWFVAAEAICTGYYDGHSLARQEVLGGQVHQVLWVGPGHLSYDCQCIAYQFEHMIRRLSPRLFQEQGGTQLQELVEHISTLTASPQNILLLECEMLQCCLDLVPRADNYDPDVYASRDGEQNRPALAQEFVSTWKNGDFDTAYCIPEYLRSTDRMYFGIVNDPAHEVIDYDAISSLSSSWEVVSQNAQQQAANGPLLRTYENKFIDEEIRNMFTVMQKKPHVAREFLYAWNVWCGYEKKRI